MKSFWRREDRLERELRAQRPEPRAELHARPREQGRRQGVPAAGPPVAARSRRGPHRRHARRARRVRRSRLRGHRRLARRQGRDPRRCAAAQGRDRWKAQPLSSARAQYLVAMCFLRHTIYVDSHAVRILQRPRRDARPLQGRAPDAAGGDDGRLHQGAQRPASPGERGRPDQGEEGEEGLLQEVAIRPTADGRSGRPSRSSRSRYGVVAADTRAGAATLRATKLEAERRTSR